MDYFFAHFSGCSDPSPVQDVLNDLSARKRASLGLGPLGSSSTYAPSQVYNLLQDSFDLLTDQGLTFRRALKPYARLLSLGGTANDEHQLLDKCNLCQGNLDGLDEGNNLQLTANNPSDISQTGSLDELDQTMYDYSHSLRDVKRLWDDWQKEMDDFLNIGEQLDKGIDDRTRWGDEELQKQETKYQEQIQKEEQLEKELERERKHRHDLEKQIEEQREELRKQLGRELEEKRANEQREAMLKQRQRQIQLENMRREQERLLEKLREEDDHSRLRKEEMKIRRQDEMRRLRNVGGGIHDKTRHENDLPNPNSARGYRTNHGQNKRVDRKPLTQLYSTLIPNEYGQRDLTVRKMGPKVQIKGKHVCGCEENCVIKEFERSFIVPEGTLVNSLKAVLYKDGTLSVMGKRDENPSLDKGSSDMKLKVPLETIGFSDQVTDDYKERLECLRKKAGIKIHKVDKRTGKPYETEEFTNTEGNNQRKYEAEYDDDGITIETLD